MKNGGVIDAAQCLLNEGKVRHGTVKDCLCGKRRNPKHQKHFKARDEHDDSKENNEKDHGFAPSTEGVSSSSFVEAKRSMVERKLSR